MPHEIDHCNSCEHDSKYEMDTKETLLQNMFWFCFIGLWAVISIGLLRLVQTFQYDNERILAILIVMFGILKFMAWIGHPRIYMRRRDE